MIENKKVTIDDVSILKESIKNLNHKKYEIEIEMIEPFEEFQDIADNAPQIILNSISM